MFGLLGWQAKLAEWVIVLAVVGGVGYYIYHKGYGEAMQDVAIAQGIADKKQQDKYNLVAQELEDTKKKRQENVRTITKTVEKIIDNPIYRNVCISDSGLSVANAAIKGEPPTITDTALPTP